MANDLRIHQNYLGGRLTYAAPATNTVVTDGVTNTTTTVTSATAAFVDADVGAPISGTNIPAGAYIASINSGTSVEISAAATGSGSGITLTIDRDLVLHSAAFAAMSTIGTTQHMMVGLDPDGLGGEPEVCKVTKHDSAATWVQVARAQESTTERAHAAGMDWAHGPFASDVRLLTLPFVGITAAVDTGVTGVTAAANVGRLAIPMAGAVTLTVVRLDLWTLVATTNDGSNYWTVKVNEATAADSDTQIGTTLDTSADTAGQNSYQSLGMNVAVGATARVLKLRVDKVGAPGDLHIVGTIHIRASA